MHNGILTYEQASKPYGDSVNRQCIDGSVRGCSKCIGYCNFDEHPGFLTEELMKKHKCFEKSCDYFIAKPTYAKTPKVKDESTNVVEKVSESIMGFEGIKIIRAEQDDYDDWFVYYVAIANYHEDILEDTIEKECGLQVKMVKLSYSFENSLSIIMGE